MCSLWLYRVEVVIFIEIFIEVIIMFSLFCSQHYYLYFIDGTVYTGLILKIELYFHFIKLPRKMN